VRPSGEVHTVAPSPPSIVHVLPTAINPASVATIPRISLFPARASSPEMTLQVTPSEEVHTAAPFSLAPTAVTPGPPAVTALTVVDESPERIV